MTVRFHYHRSQKDVPRLDIAKGDRLCHVYSDSSRDELEAWGLENGLDPRWIHEGTLPHFDAFGDRLRLCGPGVTRAQLKEHIRFWRSKAPRP
ncbi:MAG: DUF4031 domain-containing protein [Gemmatimonadetes bacterium]|nr:DUF4031 domain-containing protein [Gemmatimonadota bacterium]